MPVPAEAQPADQAAILHAPDAGLEFGGQVGIFNKVGISQAERPVKIISGREQPPRLLLGDEEFFDRLEQFVRDDLRQLLPGDASAIGGDQLRNLPAFLGAGLEETVEAQFDGYI